MEHMERINKGLPCNAPGGVLFSATNWQPKVTTASKNSDDNNDDNDEHASTIIDTIGFHLANIFTTPATIISPNSTATTKTKETVNKSIQAKFNEFLSSLPADPINPTAPLPADSTNLVEALEKALTV